MHFTIDVASFLQNFSVIGWDAQFHIAKTSQILGLPVPDSFVNIKNIDTYPSLTHYSLAIINLVSGLSVKVVLNFVVIILAFLGLPLAIGLLAYSSRKSVDSAFYSAAFFLTVFSVTSYIGYQSLLPQVTVLVAATLFVALFNLHKYKALPALVFVIVNSHRYALMYFVPVILFVVLQAWREKRRRSLPYLAISLLMLPSFVIFNSNLVVDMSAVVPSSIQLLKPLENLRIVLFEATTSFLLDSPNLLVVLGLGLTFCFFLAGLAVGLLYSPGLLLFLTFFPFLFYFVDPNARVLIHSIPFFSVIAGSGFDRIKKFLIK